MIRCQHPQCSTPVSSYSLRPYCRKHSCVEPPNGWFCTRPAGHNGPCAAHQIQEEPTPWWVPASIILILAIVITACVFYILNFKGLV